MSGRRASGRRSDAPSGSSAALLLDIGNTRVKWARFRGQRLGRQHAEPYAGWKTADFAREVFGTARGLGRVVVCSVAGRGVNRMVADAARRACGLEAEFIASQRTAGGVTTAYLEPWRLGVDRFAMAIGGHHLAKGRAVFIISVGTALTIDLVDARGLHRGGAILPAPALMLDSLLTKTVGIRRRATGARGRGMGSNLFARTTRAAIERGALLAAAAAVDRGASEARRALGRRRAPLVLLTGGGAKAVAPLLRTRYRSVPDLVLQGLAVLASDVRSHS